MTDVGNWVCWDTVDNGACDDPLGWMPTGGSTAREVAGLLPGTTYYWQVRTTLPDGTTPDANDGTWWRFTTAGSAPLTKQSPATGVTGLGTTVALQWASSLTGAGYWVCWDTTDNGTCDSAWWPNGGSGMRTLEGLTPGVYYWQVRGDTGGGSVYGDGGAWWSFRVGAPPPAPPGAFAKTAPASGGAGVGTPVTLTWAASAGATSYEVLRRYDEQWRV